MCILCVIQKWSRRVATMLPWLVIPLIGLWALSQLLPPAFRFEITSPRLACVFVLLVTLFWYEILMPQLSAWRVRRNVRLMERKRSEAIELQKLRKTATRRCRNCLTPYRDQNPGGGKFMCSYCGHISKRPVLDLPVPPSNSGLIKDLVGKGGKILNGKAWSDNGWICSQDWLENGNWTSGKPNYWRKNENCLTEKSYSGFAIFACKLLTSFFLSIRWIWRKIFRASSSEDVSSDSDHRGMLTKRGENGSNESRGEKARRKAEEKRQARLEKELLEEEERKQREEVARLVEERRRLRDEKTEAEKDRNKSSPSTKDKERKKEAEKKRQERRKEKDKGSSKSNSDVEELEKKSCEQKREFDKRWEHQKSGTDNMRCQNAELGHGLKHLSSSYSRGNAGTRYLDRMRGTFLSSSRAFTGSGFFGKTVNTSNVTKESKINSSVDHGHSSVHRRDVNPPECGPGKSHTTGDDKNVNRPVLSEPQPKKSWQQLFTRSSSVTSSNPNVISRPNPKPQTEVQSPRGQSSTVQSFDNPISFGLPSPFTLSTYQTISTSTSLGFSPPIEPIYPEEPELFEDPCYVPDPISLLGPVSESLDNFQLDLERPHVLKNLTASSPEVSKPSPIESPLSRLHNGSIRLDDVNSSDNRSWQMWDTAPLGQDSWLLPPELGRTNKESQKTMASLFSTDDQIRSPQKGFLGNGAFSPVNCANENDPWLRNGFYPPLLGSDSHLPVKSRENEVVYGSPTGAASNHSFEISPANSWSKKEWSGQGRGEGGGKSSVGRPNIGGLFPADVHSLWSFE